MAQTNFVTEFSLENAHISDRRGPIRWIASHARRQWYLILLAVVAATGNGVLAAIQPVYIGDAFNELMKSNLDIGLLKNIALLIGGVQILRAGIMLLRSTSFEITGQRVERDIRHEIYLSLLGKSMTFHSLQPVGDTMARATNDVREINFMFNPGFNMVIGSLNFLIVPILFAPRYHPSLVLTPILFIIFYVIAILNYLKILQPLTTRVRAAFGTMNTRLAEALDGIETVKGSAEEDREVSLFNHNMSDYRSAMIRQGDEEAKFLPLLLLSIAMGVGLLHALLLYRAGILNMGQVIGYFGLLLMLDFPTFASLFAYSQLSLGVASARRILSLINRENNLDQNLSGYQQRMRGDIEFRNVSFSYASDSDPVLKNVSFKVKGGQTVAIVGQTGSGKTTLAKLVNRVYDATRGEVLVDGVNVRDWNLDKLRTQISTIEQDIFLFSKTISENIAFGKQDASEEEVRQVARFAQADEFINTFKEGYNTVLGERGVTLSGGQRQRVALARAFLTDPRILILDDSTSAIDSETEDRIQQAIFKAAEGRTTLIITHRLSQIRWADLIIVMRQGEIAAIGTHDTLMRDSEAYRQIFSE